MSKASQSNSPRLGDNPIAIIGMSALFPQAEHLGQYWNNIVEQIDSIIEIPESRWKIEDYFDEDQNVPDKSYSKRGGFIPDVDFNPMDFGIPPNILEVTDSSQLLGLLTAKKRTRRLRIWRSKRGFTGSNRSDSRGHRRHETDGLPHRPSSISNLGKGSSTQRVFRKRFGTTH
jgi:acyl transferase domain-containing protein